MATTTKAKSKPGTAAAPTLDQGTIGYIVHDYTNPYFSEVARSIEQAVADEGFGFVLAQSRGSAPRELAVANALAEQSVDGLLISPADTGPDHLAALEELPVYTVLLDVDDAEGWCSVWSDNVLAGNLAGQHLIDQGHERIAVLTPPPHIKSCADRVSGLKAAVSAAGLDPDKVVHEVVVPFGNAREGQGAVARITGKKPTAVFCINDLLALGLMRGLSSKGVSIPDDIAVMGCDDADFAHSLETPLSTLRAPKKEMATAAARLLLAELSGKAHRHKRESFRPTLVARASTGA